MRIAYFFHDRPNYVGGPTIKALRLLPELARRGHDVIPLVFYIGKGSPVAEILANMGLEPRAIRRPLFTERQVSWTLRQVAEIQPDVFFCGSYVGPCLAARWVRDAGIPTVAACLSVDEFNLGLAEMFATDGPWTVSGMACISNAVRGRVEQFSCQRIKVRTIIHGVPIPQQQASQEGPIRLVYLGRLEEPAKRISLLLEAIVKVLRDDRDITATIIGSGYQRETLERRVLNVGMTDRICFTGAIPPENLDKHLLDCHIVVHLPDYEGLGSSIVHAMSYGLVPVCLDAPGGLSELVLHDETGLFVQDRDEGFRNAIARLAADRSYRVRLAKNAREHIRRHFSLEESADQWERLFETLVREAGTPRTIRIPLRLSLPPIFPKLAAEDVRRTDILRLSLRKSRRFIARAIGRINRISRVCARHKSRSDLWSE